MPERNERVAEPGVDYTVLTPRHNHREFVMQIDRSRSWAALLLLGFAAGCAGNGEGLNQNGQPISSGGNPGGPVTADFQSIQDNVFTPICSQCHIGASAPEGLQLDAAHDVVARDAEGAAPRIGRRAARCSDYKTQRQYDATREQTHYVTAARSSRNAALKNPVRR